MGMMEKLREAIPCIISRRTSFITMTLLLGSFFLVEVVVGYITNSMALIADSFHMLSDVASLIVGFLALQYSTIEAPREVYTYGYARAEVLGALVNAVFLVALCFSIFIEALKRLVILEEIENPMLVLIVGVIGLVVNLFGMFLFHQTGHGHSHGGLSHSHSHGGGNPQNHSHGGHSHSDHGHSHGGGGHGHSHGKPQHSHEPLMIPKQKSDTPTSLSAGVEDSKHGAKSHSTPVNSRDTFSPSLDSVPENEQTSASVVDMEQALNENKTFSMNDISEKQTLLDNDNKSNNSHHSHHHDNSTNASSEAFNRSHVKNISSKYPSLSLI